LKKKDFAMRIARLGGAGFTLIEILVSMLLLAIGFLGLAAVQSKSLSETQNTQFRSKADILLRDIADRMRANAEAVTTGGYLIDKDAVSSHEAPQDCPLDPAAYTCLAVRDLTLWINSVDEALPEPHVLIADAGDGVQRIRIDWSEKRVQTQDRSANPCGADLDRSCTELRVLINGDESGG
jgi:type IV pilus assembly protein PilV